jgi:Peptidase of plants and bacteria
MIARSWRRPCSHRSLWRVTQRAWLVSSLLAFAACGKGTSGWVLNDRAPATVMDSGPDADAGQAGDAGQPGQVADSGADGLGGSLTAPVDRCPTRFASVCSPTVVVNNMDATASGKLFSDSITDPAATLGCITRDTCDILYLKASEIRVTTKITITIEDYDGVSETWSPAPGESIIHMSSRHLQQVSDAHADVGREIRGIFYYHATNIYQYDGGNGTANSWLISGVANYVRHVAGYMADDQRRAGGAYNDGGQTSAFFFVWLDQNYAKFVYELNMSLDPNNGGATWTTKSFQDITGQSVDMLWASYQATL